MRLTLAKRALKELLRNTLPAKLQQADGIRGDGITTPVPFEIHSTDVNALGGYPALELIPSDSTKTVDSYSRIKRHRIAIAVSVGGDDEEVIAVHLETYLWAICEVANDTQLTPPETTGPIDTGGEQYTPLQQQREKTIEYPFVKGAFIEVFITTVE